jgi:hypothetical protein
MGKWIYRSTITIIIIIKEYIYLQLGRGQENVDLYIHSPIRLHGVVLN